MNGIKNSFIIIFALIIFVLIIFSSCEKPIITKNPSDKLIFSTDTIQFDTIFTTIGSATKYFTVKNSNTKKTIIVDRIFVAKGSQSKYKLNINGVPTNNVSNIELAPGDSIFIFVMVNINPGRDEMVEQDSVVFMSNGNTQDVKLVAFGQDVHLIDGQVLNNDTTWTATKPFLIYNSALVSNNTTLTIQAGTKIYFHKNSGLLVNGTIKVNGEVNNRVLFTGDRLEQYYAEIPGQWGTTIISNPQGQTMKILGGIYLLSGSKYNEIFNADIKNSMIGLRADSCVTVDAPTVYLKNVNIENSQIAGLYAMGAYIIAENCVFANSGSYNVGCIIGGKYYFIHCTLANFWKGMRETPQLLFNNYYKYTDINGLEHVSNRPLELAYFGNCIIDGSKDNEIGIDYHQTAEMNLVFENSLIKYKDTAALKQTGVYLNNIYNKSAEFQNIMSPYDYQLEATSPAKDAGKLEISQMYPFDQKGNSRISDEKPDLGAFEFIPINSEKWRKR